MAENESGIDNYDITHSFEAWVEAGTKLGNEKFPDWHPKMIERMANNFGWRAEGMFITGESVEIIFDDWITGQSPYSPHGIPNDGYDWELLGLGETNKSYSILLDFGMNVQKLDKCIAERFAHDCADVSTMSVDECKRQYRDWISGKNKMSPHHIPFSDVVQEARRERRRKLRIERHHLSDFIFELNMMSEIPD